MTSCAVAHGTAELSSSKTTVPVDILTDSIPVGGAFVLTTIAPTLEEPRHICMIPTISYYPRSSVDFHVTEWSAAPLSVAWTVVACSSGLQSEIYNFTISDLATVLSFGPTQKFSRASAVLSLPSSPSAVNRRFAITHFTVSGTTFGEDEMICTRLNETTRQLHVELMAFSTRMALDVRVQVIDWDLVDNTTIDFVTQFTDNASFRAPATNTLLIGSTCADFFTTTPQSFTEAGFFAFTTSAITPSQLSAPKFANSTSVGSILGIARRRAVFQHVKLAASAAQVSYVDVPMAKQTASANISLPFSLSSSVPTFAVLLAPTGFCAPTDAKQAVKPALFPFVTIRATNKSSSDLHVFRRSSNEAIQCTVAIVRLTSMSETIAITSGDNVKTTAVNINTTATITDTTATTGSTTGITKGITSGTTNTTVTTDTTTSHFSTMITTASMTPTISSASTTSAFVSDSTVAAQSDATPALSTAELGGIIGGSVAGGLLMLVLLLVCLFRGRKNKAREITPTTPTSTYATPSDRSVYGDVSDVRNSTQMSTLNEYSDVSDIHT
jgi:hypothetical protein